MSGRLAVAVATALVLAALVVGAPTVDERTTPSDAAGGAVSAGQQGPSSTVTIQEPPTAGPFVLVVLLVLMGVALAYGLKQYGRDDLVLAVVTTVVLTVAAVIVGSNPTVAGAFQNPVTNTSGGGGPASTGTGPGSLWLVGVVGSLAAVALAGIVLRRAVGSETWTAGGDDGHAERTESASDDVPDGVADAADRAADTLADGETSDNAVYRAWTEMTAALDVPDAESATPGEFAAAAREAGMDPEHVATLTDLFEAVRYGDRSVTEDRARRAERALRNVEGRGQQ
ncbi:DUF4129 domain-containing protein [Haloarcula marina]|uniref:DUF4129 domain-containing protein n=1 Tax=Haloarcula marina TaxID=2961574 RepID=UPI0020B6DDD3|nr:DUF4129 domain-containing protein [Halomicroarcula marina]